MSFFGKKQSANAAPEVQNFHPVTSSLQGYGELSPEDTKWHCSTKGFGSETHTWYTILEDGCWIMVQIIWSYTGIFMIPATTQMTFKHYNPVTRVSSWKSVSVNGFKHDSHSCKSDTFEIKHTGSPTTEESYRITANLDKTVQIDIMFTRPADSPGFKLGKGPGGGVSVFGKDASESKRDGIISHRFLPVMQSSGHVVINGQMVDAKGDGMFVHAIQGLRPDSAASRWNFGFFTTAGDVADSKLGRVRALQMEFETTDYYGPTGPKSGRTKVNMGVVTSSKLSSPLIVVGQTSCAAVPTAFPALNDDVSAVTQTPGAKDKDTGYNAPSAIEFKWAGNRVGGEKGRVSAAVAVPLLGTTVGEGGLIEKVDVLAEIPYVLRKTLAAVTGTKPYIYQYLNSASLHVELDGEAVEVQGWLFNEATFVSE
ncbi:oxidative stress survival, Svf1-like protein [Dioszegia hungarica]|uniref:Oxidative stress survival, Svf1-like protein n=1 Tax=Dioszegia hungarica TaxID=4972 RepID=A0AA38HF15_9TREE|nr:oxidative stress survival, Svf1-like protein [Dioszegia hungarica]KAI9639430.1 oxidative stress survival, Svf1-like protein [Dioszegia hungarica]